MNLREAAQQALDDLEYFAECGWESDAIAALRAALSEDRVADTGKTYDNTDDTPEQRMLREKWFGGRLYGHLPFLAAVDETMKNLHDQLDELKGTWNMLDNHFPDVSKMVATIRPEVTVEPVATINKMETVEPVAWMRADRGHVDFHRHPDYLPLYTTAPPGIVARAVATERECIAAWVEDMCAGLDAKTIANGIRNGGNDDMRAFEVRK